MNNYVVLLLIALGLNGCFQDNQDSPQSGEEKKEIEQEKIRKELEEFEKEIETASPEEVINQIEKSDSKNKNKYVQSAFAAAFEKNDEKLINRLLNQYDSINASVDENDIVRKLDDKIYPNMKRGMVASTNEETMRLHKLAYIKHNVINYLKSGKDDVLVYALAHAAAGDGNVIDAATKVIKSDRVKPVVKDVVFALKAVKDERLILELLNKIDIKNLSEDDKRSLTVHVVINSTPLVAKKLYEEDENIFKQKELFADGNAFDAVIATYNRNISGIISDLDPAEIERSKQIFMYLKSLKPDQVPRIREEIPNESNPAAKNIMVSMSNKTISDQEIIQQIKTNNVPLEHIEPVFGKMICVALKENRYDVFNYLRKTGALLDTYCGSVAIKHVAGFAIEWSLIINCKNKPHNCDAFIEFLVDFLADIKIDTISDNKNTIHPVLKMLIDAHEYKGDVVALKLLQKRPKISKSFYADGNAKSYVTKLIQKLEQEHKETKVLKEVLQKL